MATCWFRLVAIVPWSFPASLRKEENFLYLSSVKLRFPTTWYQGTYNCTSNLLRHIYIMLKAGPQGTACRSAPTVSLELAGTDSTTPQLEEMCSTSRRLILWHSMLTLPPTRSNEAMLVNYNMSQDQLVREILYPYCVSQSHRVEKSVSRSSMEMVFVFLTVQSFFHWRGSWHCQSIQKSKCNKKEGEKWLATSHYWPKLD